MILVLKGVSPVQIVVATRNPGKLKEIKQIMGNVPVEFISLKEALRGEKIELEEPGDTYLENALHKAKTVARFTGMCAIADDSGLEVDYLNGEPGVHSSRFAGEDASDDQNIEKLLKLLEGVPEEERTARFRCLAVFYDPCDVILSSDGVCEGTIITEKRGRGGFGYDPIFVPYGYEKTFAELPLSIKNKISHRAKAFKNLRRKIVDYFDF